MKKHSYFTYCLLYTLYSKHYKWSINNKHKPNVGQQGQSLNVTISTSLVGIIQIQRLD